MKLYDLVLDVLQNQPKTRSSDKALIWEVLRRQGCLITIGSSYGETTVLNYDGFLDAPTFESITRARRKVQEIHPELQAVEQVRQVRKDLSRGDPIDIFRDLI